MRFFGAYKKWNTFPNISKTGVFIIGVLMSSELIQNLVNSIYHANYTLVSKLKFLVVS